jgi:hypothetical protein
MVEDCVPRGCRTPGRRRLRRFLILLLALVACGALATPALGSSRSSPGGSGGIGLGAGGTGGGTGAPQKPPPGKHWPKPRGNPLTGRAMWIWELPYTDGGNLTAIIAYAHQYGVRTLFIKSSDGTGFWTSQFTPQLVSALHSAGIHVCAWQYVYGDHPITEAYMGADAVHMGADCLVIDAETEYQGKYIAAQSYMGRLRLLIGPGYPLVLAGFPYIDFHPGFPYSVFLGPGGAQYNAPQMYWKDIGTTTDAVFAHTYAFNLIYRRPIYPLGQVFNAPPDHQIFRFRELSRVYGASGVSWWDWQESSVSEWSTIAQPAGGIPGYAAYKQMATVGQGAQGDLVVWAQEHLISAGYPVAVDGNFGATTLSAVQAFQTAKGLTPDGLIGPATWAALLNYPPANIVFGFKGNIRHGRLARAGRYATTGPSARRGGVIYAPVPKSASRPEKRNELGGAPGAGRQPRR